MEGSTRRSFYNGHVKSVYPACAFMMRLKTSCYSEVYVLCTILCIGFYTNKFLVLVVHFLSCLLLDTSKNRSLFLVLLVGCSIYAEFAVLTTAIPNLRRFDLKFIFFMVTVFCFVAQYFIYSLQEMHLMKPNSEILEIIAHTSFPAVCCIISCSIICHIFQLNISYAICLYSFPVFWDCGQYQPSIFTYLHSLLFRYSCIVVLLVIPVCAPLISACIYEVELHTVEFLFLLFGTTYLTCLLPNRVINLSVTIAKRVLPGIVLILGLMTCLDRLGLGNLGVNASSWLLYMQLLMFPALVCCCLSTLLLGNKSSNKVSRYLKIACCCCAASLFMAYNTVIEQIFSQSRWPAVTARHLLKLPTNLTICVTFSLLSILTYGHIEPGSHLLLVAAALCSFHFAEWRIYQSFILTDTMFLGSSLIALTVTFLWYVTSKDRLHRLSAPTPVQFVTTCLLAPSLTKLTLVCLNYLDAVSHNQAAAPGSGWWRWWWDRDSLQQHRVAHDIGLVLGLFLVYLGLASGRHLFLFGARLLNHLLLRARRLLLQNNGAQKTGYPPGAINLLLGVGFLLLYFAIAACFCHRTITHLLAGKNSFNSFIILPLIVLLSGFALHLPTPDECDKDYCRITQFKLASADLDRCAEALLKLGFLCLWTTLIICQVFGSFMSGVFVLLSALLCVISLLWLIVRLFAAPLWSWTWTWKSLRSGYLLAMSLASGGVLWTVLRLASCISGFDLALFLVYFVGLASLHYWDQFYPRGVSTAMVQEQQTSLSHYFRRDELIRLGQPDTKKNLVLTRTRPVLRVKLAIMWMTIFTCLVVWISDLRSDYPPGVYMWKTIVLATAILLVGQVADSRGIKALVSADPQRSASQQSSRRRRRRFIAEDCLFQHTVNLTVVGCILLLLSVLASVDMLCVDNIQLLFIPCLLSLLRYDRRPGGDSTTASAAHSPLLLPLLVLTGLLLSASLLQSPAWTGGPDLSPLPTFTGRYQQPASADRTGDRLELVLCLGLTPIHLVFLADQASVPLFRLLLSAVRCRLLAYWACRLCALVVASAYLAMPACIGFTVLANPSSLAARLYVLYSCAVAAYLLLRVRVSAGDSADE